MAIVAAGIFLAYASLHNRAQTQEMPQATVSGVVKNRLTGQPIARALVDAQFDAMLTDGEGRFELHVPNSFGTQLHVRRPGYTSGEESGHRLNVQGDIAGMVLYLIPTATITGHVSTPDGSDTTGMSFMAYRRRTRNGHTQWQQAGGAETNADGVFKMYDMQSPGDYVLCNQMYLDRTAGPRQGKPERGIPSQCYPAEPGEGADSLLHLSPGQQAEAEITRAMQPFYPVRMLVSNRAAGEPQGGMQVYSQNGIATGAPMQSKDEGWTEIDLPTGSYYAERRNWGKAMSYGRVDFKVGNGAPAALTLVSLPLAPVEVRFRKEFTARAEVQGTHLARAVPPDKDSPPAQLELMRADGMNENGGAPSIRHPEGASGDVFEMDGITPGRYWVQAAWSAEGYVSSMTSGGVDLSREPLTIGPGNVVLPIEVTLRNDTGQIDVTVDGNAMRSAAGPGTISSSRGAPLGGSPAVYAIPVGGRFSRGAHAMSFMGSVVSLPDLAPGRYSVFALEDERDVDSLDEQELAHLEEKGKLVTVPAEGTVSVRLDLITAEDEGQAP